MNRMTRLVGAVAITLVAAACSDLRSAPEAELATAAQACKTENNDTYEKLLECVTAEGVREHQAALQEIADANNGNRAAGTEGYAESVSYVAGLLEEAGYDVTLEPFEFTFASPARLEQLTPDAQSYATGAYTGSGSGEVAGTVIPVDLALGLPRNSTSACEAADFDGLDFSGDADIALVQRGTCPFGDKVENAQAAGAEAVIIFNQGDDSSREGLSVGTLGAQVAVPVVGSSFDRGVALSAEGSTARVSVQPSETRTDFNVIAELPGKDADNVVMAGAHLDSVRAGPGINDNGSGSAAILEVALNLAKLEPENTLRFAWWGAEELGLVGSSSYVESLSQSELARIALYLNFDMVGSPNYILTVYDADESSFAAPNGVPIPAGSAALEKTLESFYTYAEVPYDDSQFSGRSDYQAFIENGVPSSGLFTGAEGTKTARQAAIWGGTAGAAYDGCYHQACDTFDNNNSAALDVNADAIAFSMLTYAYSTESVNGVAGEEVPGNFELPAPAGPQGTFVGTDGGLGHDHDHEGETE